MPVNLSEWPFGLPDERLTEMLDVLAECDNPLAVRAALSAFLVGDLILGAVYLDSRAMSALPAPPPRRRGRRARLASWRPW